MSARLVSGEVLGVEGRALEVEVAVQPGLSQFLLSGLPGAGARDGRERIRASIRAAGFRFPNDARIVVNLAPAVWQKGSAVLDLPIALAILIATEQVKLPTPGRWGILGELSLDGWVRPVPGTLALVAALREEGIERALVPVESLEEARAVGGLETLGVSNLRHAAAVLEERAEGDEVSRVPVAEPVPDEDGFGRVLGHGRIKRALALAAAGRHNVLLVGPPGSGKTLLARSLRSILPEPDPEERIEITTIHSVAGLEQGGGLARRRPFRAPHHTTSYAGLVGGGSDPRPGEVTLAHRGVLFLDELPEFPRRALEALREPLEEGRIRIARAQATLDLPAEFILIAAMNPCPCGHHGDPHRRCVCPPRRIRSYVEKISGPLLDRIDIRLATPAPSADQLFRRAVRDETGEDLRQLVATATDFRRQRHPDGLPATPWTERDHWARPTPSAEKLLRAHAEEGLLSARGLSRVLRVARTIADTTKRDRVDDAELLEALDLYLPGEAEGVMGELAWR